MAPAATYQTIHLHFEAPTKPPVGAACNGCGMCCASAPCPIGMLVSKRRRGRCSALIWQDEAARYVCGMLTDPAAVTGVNSPTLARWISAFAARSIAAGVGCDAVIDTV